MGAEAASEAKTERITTLNSDYKTLELREIKEPYGGFLTKLIEFYGEKPIVTVHTKLKEDDLESILTAQAIKRVGIKNLGEIHDGAALDSLDDGISEGVWLDFEVDYKITKNLISLVEEKRVDNIEFLNTEKGPGLILYFNEQRKLIINELYSGLDSTDVNAAEIIAAEELYKLLHKSIAWPE